MSEPSHEAQQVAVHMIFGLVPILRVRKSVPTDAYSWEWGRWRWASPTEAIVITAMLMKTWKP